MKLVATSMLLFVGAVTAQQNANCDCLDDRCTSQMAVCRNDDDCIEAIDCCCACPEADPTCALACVAPYFSNPATLGVGICGGNEGCWFLKSAEEKTVAKAMVTLYKLESGACGQSTLDETIAPFAVEFAGLEYGMCADFGYTQLEETQTITVPIVGDIIIEVYSAPATEKSAPATEKKSDQNANCDCLDDRCTSQMAVCRNDDQCIEAIDCCCACPEADPTCALACVAPYFSNPATLGVGICGGNEGCWFLKNAGQKQLRGAALPFPLK